MVDDKEKQKINPNIVIVGVIVLLVSILLVFGFLVWDNNNKRDIEFQREKLEQEKVIEEKKLQEQKDLEADRKKEEKIDESNKNFCRKQYLDCYDVLLEHNPQRTSREDVEYMKGYCLNLEEKCLIGSPLTTMEDALRGWR